MCKCLCCNILAVFMAIVPITVSAQDTLVESEVVLGRAATNQMTTYITSFTFPGGTISPYGQKFILKGTDITFTVIPDYGHHIQGVEIDGEPVDIRTSYTFTNVADNHTIVAAFERNQYTLSSSADNGGCIWPAGTFDFYYGDNITYSIAPDPGYAIAAVIVDGVNQGPVSSYTIEGIDAEATIEAHFAPAVTYEITAMASYGGTISPAGTHSVNEGSDAVYTVSPNSGYRIWNVRVDGVWIGARSSYTFDDVDGPHSIVAAFQRM